METINENKKYKKQVHGFSVLENECVWMKTGVVNFRECDNDFDCNSCPFDKAMQKAMGGSIDRNSLPADRSQWVQNLKKRYSGASRPCRHTLTGRIDFPKICTMSYECFHCPFDQALDQEDFASEISSPNVLSASGFQLADGYYFHMGHSWARFEHGGRVRIGFDDFLNKIFGIPETISLPPLGAKLIQNEAGLEFSRKGNKGAVLSPITGTVLNVNQEVQNNLNLVRKNPYDKGWLCMIEPDMPKRNLKNLFFGKESFQWMENEAQRLNGLIGQDNDRLAATGGEIIENICDNFPEIGWHTLQKEFLKTS